MTEKLQSQRSMEWTEQHDILMLREMLVSSVFSFKKGSVSRGEAWDSMVEKVNAIESPPFRIKDKRGLRDRWLLLRRKWKNKTRMEESASGIVVEEPTEKEVLIEELVGREDSPCEDSTATRQRKDKETGDDMRKKAMESMGETKKRKSSSEDDLQKKKGTRRCSQPLIDFLQAKASADRELRQQEMEIKKLEQEKQQEIIQGMLLQQQQMNQAFVSVVQKLLEK